MKKLYLFLAPLALLAADPQKKPAAKPDPAPQAVTVPADAKEIAPRVWRHTDKDGKTWIYRQTPFGLSKVEERAPAPAASAPPPVEITATEQGDNVRFEKPGPMGSRVWTKSKNELTDEEKEILEKSKSKKSGK